MKKLLCTIFAFSIVLALVGITNAKETDAISDYEAIAGEADASSNYENMRREYATILINRLSEIEKTGDILHPEDKSQHGESVSFTREQCELYERERLNNVLRLMQYLEEGEN